MTLPKCKVCGKDKGIVYIAESFICGDCYSEKQQEVKEAIKQTLWKNN